MRPARPHTPPATTSAPIGETRLVGRRTELARFSAALDARQQAGHLFLLVGEAGIGKSSAAEAMASHARRNGARVYVGRAFEGEGAPPFWPWVEILRSWVSETEDEALRVDLAEGASEIAGLDPRLGERLAIRSGRVALDDEFDRFRVFDAATSLLRRTCRRGRLVLVIDDLHWADLPTLSLLRFVAQRLGDTPIVVVATCRDPVPEGRRVQLSVIEGIASSPHVERLPLRGLPIEDTTRVVEEIAGAPAGRLLVNAVQEASEGNPLLVREIVRLLVSEGRFEPSEPDARPELSLPRGAHAIVAQRLERLSHGCRELLAVASVIGKDFDLPLLAVASERGPAQILEELAPAEAAGVLQTGKDPGGRWRFSHGLIRELLYEGLPRARRVVLHRRVGLFLEERLTVEPDRWLPVVAHHLARAALGGGDPEKAFQYAVQAAEHASRNLAFEDAVAHTEEALAVLALRREAAPGTRCDLLLALGDSLARAGEHERARRSFLQAAGLARSEQQSRRFARAAIGYGAVGYAGLWVAAGIEDPALDELLEEALRMLGPDDDALRARVLSSLSIQLHFARAYERQAALAVEAVEAARRSGDPTALGHALNSRQIAAWGTEGIDEGIALADELVALGGQARNADVALLGHYMRVIHLLERGDVAAVEIEMDLFTRRARELRRPVFSWYALRLRPMQAILEGRLAEAEALAAEAFALGKQIHEANAAQSYGLQLYALRLEQGRIAELEAGVRAFAERFPAIGAWRVALLSLFLEIGREDEAREGYARLAERGFVDFPRDLFWLPSMVHLAELAAAFGDARRAATLYDLILPFARRNVVVGYGIAYDGTTSHYLGLLCSVLGLWSEGARHFEEALLLSARSGARPREARTQLAFARFLLQRDSPGDRERALELLERAFDLCRALGLRALESRVLETRAKAQQLVLREARTAAEAFAHPKLPPGGSESTVTLLFSDIEGFSAMTERLGDREAWEVVRRHHEIVRAEVALHGGIELELQGDGFLIAFSDPLHALRCAVALQRAFEADAESHPRSRMRVRIGVHAGEALKSSEGFFGRTVIMASRVAAHAGGGEILVSESLGRVAFAAGEFALEDAGEFELKGLAGRHRLRRLAWR